jgi:hypothetical protein
MIMEGLMGVRLTYKDFSKKRLSKAEEDELWSKLASRHRQQLEERVKIAAAERARYEPFRLALAKMYQQNGVAEASFKCEREPEKEFPQVEAPSPPRLRKRIFQTGSLHVVDIPSLDPSAGDPFVEWGWGQALDNAGGNNGTSSYTLTPADANIGQGTLAINTNGSGTAYGWAYVGQFFSPPAQLADYNEAFLQISMAPTINSWYNYGVNWFNYANLVFNVNIMVIIYGSGNPQCLNFPTASLVNLATNNPSNSGGIYGIFATDLPQLSASLAISTENSYGIFLQFYAYAERSGGSWSQGNINFQLPAIQLDALCGNT